MLQVLHVAFMHIFERKQIFKIFTLTMVKLHY